MSRIAYVNGRYLPHAAAGLSIDDRAVLFADSVYEVCEVKAGRIVDVRLHLDRLARSLAAIGMPWPLGRPALARILVEVAARNRVRDGLVYLQVSRGAARRDFYFPAPDVAPSLVVTARSVDRAAAEAVAAEGINVVTMPDNRWERVDIKTTGLLPNVLAKEAARSRGGREAWFVDADGLITEGGSSNAWIVTQAGVVRTRPAEQGILRGVTRTTLLKLIEEEGLALEERPFNVDEAYAAKEAFNTAATALVMPVVRINGRPIGAGRPGPLATRLRRDIHDVAEFTDIHARVTN
ncbi:D-amino-acid transaminase [Chelatococcus reniformis]|uniref:Probable branched-chain-amino-acid aminotransferase n=1 Tax=Chelatococcus reniformis TaxID=1494448 RepID=A0A916U0M2_9HYPH|nr:D-amino-acid transaminase [Chelatococcus reniformis]GGC55791.1 D-amino-acid transaminase [Chelatococcus reniformis]